MSVLYGPPPHFVQSACDMAAMKRPASPFAHASAVMTERKPFEERAGREKLDMHSPHPGAHASAAAAHGPREPPHGFPVAGARRDVAGGMRAAQPWTAGFSQKAEHVPEAHPAGGGGGG